MKMANTFDLDSSEFFFYSKRCFLVRYYIIDGFTSAQEVGGFPKDVFYCWISFVGRIKPEEIDQDKERLDWEVPYVGRFCGDEFWELFFPW